MNAKIQRVSKDIEKTKDKINEFQTRLRELEKQKTELENADIIAAVRGVDIAPEELEEFIRLYQERGQRLAPETPVHDSADDDMILEEDIDENM